MNSITRRKARILVIFGLFVIVFAQIIPRYFSITDGFQGLFMGIGIGMLLLPLIRNRFTPKSTR